MKAREQGAKRQRVDPESFHDLMRRLRAGDPQAAEQVVARYGAVIQIAVRARLRNPQLRRVLDTVDVCQSVMGSFFVRSAAGQFELKTPHQLISLLSTMAHNKLVRHVRWHHQLKRDIRRQSPLDAHELDELIDVTLPDPHRVVATRELFHECRRRMTADVRYLADQRAAGRSWQELSIELDRTPEALRMQLKRGLDEIACQLQLDGPPEGNEH